MDVNEMPQENIYIDEELSYRDVLENFDPNQSSIERETPNNREENRKRKERTETRERPFNRKYKHYFMFLH